MYNVTETAERMTARFKMLQANTLAGGTPQFDALDNNKEHAADMDMMADEAARRRQSLLETADALDAVQEPVLAESVRQNVSDPHQFANAEAARKFIFGGDAIVTFVSKMTGTRYTFKITRAKASPNYRNQRETFFVGLLSGPQNTTDYRYLGVIQDNQFRLTSASTAKGISYETASVVAFGWTFGQIMKGSIPASRVEIWHEGRCGRCGRVLTVPDSIASGFGPECLSRL